MNEYEKYLSINVLVDAYAKYQGKCMDALHTIQLRISQCNTLNRPNETMLDELVQKKAEAEAELKKISDDLSALAALRMSTLKEMQTAVGMTDENINFENLSY